MRKKYAISVRKADEPLSEPVTKFGGKPTWLQGPQWPVSKTTGHPMRFIGQFVLYPEIFGEQNAQMAYLFMTDEEVYVDGTWSPFSGENAVILQPSKWDEPAITLKETHPGQEASSLSEHEVMLEPGEDPDSLDEEVFRQRGEWDSYMTKVYESKVGGVPAFLQYPEYPNKGNWILVAQLASTLLPSELNFGDSGVGYVFLSEDGTHARFLWQG